MCERYPLPFEPTQKQHTIDISVIIPVLNEADNIYHLLQTTINHSHNTQRIEIIIVDANSQDNTIEQIQNFKSQHPDITLHIYTCPLLGRALQMKHGFHHCIGQFVLFCHADTILPKAWDQQIINNFKITSIQWCYFTLQFNASHPGLSFVEAMVKRYQVARGDQALCFRRQYFQTIGQFDNVLLCEDFHLIYTLHKNKQERLKQSKRINDTITTSARKYANRQGQYTYLSIFKNVLANMSIRQIQRLQILPSVLHYNFYYPKQRKSNILELRFLGKTYPFQYDFPKGLWQQIKTWRTYYYQRHMETLTQLIIQHCTGDDLMIDIGAHAGLLSILLGIRLTQQNVKTDIIAFEPCSKLCKTFQTNHCAYAIEIKNHITLENTLPAETYPFPEKKISVIALNLKTRRPNMIQNLQHTIEQHRPIILLTLDHDSKQQRNNIAHICKSLNYQINLVTKRYCIALPPTCD